MPDKASRALRRFCLECQGRHPPSVSACNDASCLFHPLRRVSPGADETAAPAAGDAAPGKTLRVIRLFCLGCAGGRKDVRECDAKENCALWSFRFGVLPSTFKRVVARRKKRRMNLTLPGLFPS